MRFTSAPSTALAGAALLALSSAAPIAAAPAGIWGEVSALLTQYADNLPLNITRVTKTVYSALGDRFDVTRVNSTLARGLAWAGDYNYVKSAGQASLVSWYYHWENEEMKNMP